MTFKLKLLMGPGLALMSACVTPTSRQTNIDFVWGCWVQKDQPGGKIEAFLRLLPDQESASYSGFIDKVLLSGPETALSFARDGSKGRMAPFVAGKEDDSEDDNSQPNSDFLRDYRSVPRPGGSINLVAFKNLHNERETLTAEGSDARLKISHSVAPGLVDVLFDGERDGCD